MALDVASSSNRRPRQTSSPLVIDYAYSSPTSPRSPTQPTWPSHQRHNSVGPDGPLTADTLPATFEDTPSSTASLSAAGSLAGSSNPSFTFSTGSGQIPPWPSFRLSHVILLVPITLALAPVFLPIPVFAWPPVTASHPGHSPPDAPQYPRPIEWVPMGLGAIVHAAARAVRQPTVELVQQVLLALPAVDREHHSPRRRWLLDQIWSITFDKTPVVFGSILTELVRIFGIFVLALVELPPPAFPVSSNPEASYPLLTVERIFFPTFYFGIGYAWCESVLVGGFDWTRQVFLYKEVLPATSPEAASSTAAVEGNAHSVVPKRRKASGSAPGRSSSTGNSHDDATPKQSAVHIHRPFPAEIHDLAPDERTRLLTSLPLPAGPIDGQPPRPGPGSDTSGTDPWEELVIEPIERSREREALEGTLGAPLWAVPWFIVLVWRLDALLLTLGTTLFIALPFLPPSAWPDPQPPEYPFLPLPIRLPLWPTFVVVCLVRTLITLVWTFRLRGWGLVGVSYATLLIAMGIFLGSVAAWGGLE